MSGLERLREFAEGSDADRLAIERPTVLALLDVAEAAELLDADDEAWTVDALRKFDEAKARLRKVAS